MVRVKCLTVSAAASIVRNVYAHTGVGLEEHENGGDGREEGSEDVAAAKRSVGSDDSRARWFGQRGGK